MTRPVPPGILFLLVLIDQEASDDQDENKKDQVTGTCQVFEELKELCDTLHDTYCLIQSGPARADISRRSGGGFNCNRMVLSREAASHFFTAVGSPSIANKS